MCYNPRITFGIKKIPSIPENQNKDLDTTQVMEWYTVNPKTGEIEADVVAQAKQAIGNLVALLEAAGYSAKDVIKTTVFIKNMDDFAKVNAVYSEFFTKDCPARSCVEVARLPKDVLIEIEAIGLKS